MVMTDYNKRDKYDIPNKQDSIIDGIRIACHKSDIFDCIEYAKVIKTKGYLTGIQIMAITNYKYEELEEIAEKMDGLDLVSLADSNGSLLPNNVGAITWIFRGYSYAVIFHPHNNMQLAFANSIVAIDLLIDIIDCSFNGIGRGAGNLPTELIMAYLNKYQNCEFNLDPVLNCIDDYISHLTGGYKWGYNVPNMLSGIHEIHPYYGRDSSKYNLTKARDIIREVGIEKPMKYYGKKKIICVIPARYESTRFSGKPLELINGEELIKLVYKNASGVELFNDVLVATDDDRIKNYCDDNNIKCIMTPKNCITGTDRLYEVSKNMDADLYINLQGDEPLLLPISIKEFIERILECGEINRVAFNGITECNGKDVENINVPKIIINVYGDLLYMSRLPIPYKKSNHETKYYKELGLHGYTKKGLEWFNLHKEQFNSEKSEGLEFLRFLETGELVRTINLDLPIRNHAIDVKEDIKEVEKLLNEARKRNIIV